MNMRSIDYAQLSEHTYDRRGNLAQLVNQKVVVGGIEYMVLEHSEKSSGYQGTIYQRTDTKEIVVAHRGTEFSKLRSDTLETVKDLVVADGGMVVGRSNIQASDAIALTRRALEIAETQKQQLGIDAPVTVTGHSLGGTLAQITAHYFDIKGETFNAFGAASLNIRHPVTGEKYHLPTGGDNVLNHVMGADFVSAASPHFGRVRVYATPAEVSRLEGFGYENNRSRFDIRAGDLAAAKSLDSHDMHHFLPVDANRNKDRSVLLDPAAQKLAEAYDPMFDKYRNDVMTLRRGATVVSRGANGLIEDIVEGVRGPWATGEPARREQLHLNRRGASLEESALPDMRNPGHPANGMYRQAFAGVEGVDRSMGRTSDASTERLAASLTAAGAGLADINQVALSRDGSRAFAMETARGPAEAGHRVDVAVAAAVQRPVEDSTRDWQDATQRIAQERDAAQARERNVPAVGGPIMS